MIRRIRIQNFKSIRDVTVDLDPVTVLIGRSGTGKTNFCEAVRWLRDCLVDGLAKSWPSLAKSQSMTNDSKETSFEIDFTVAEYLERFSYKLTVSTGGPVGWVLVSEGLAINDEYMFLQDGGAIGRGSVKAPTVSIPPPLTATLQPGGLLLPQLAGLEFATVALTALTSGLGVYTFALNVLSSFKAGGTGLWDDASNALGAIQGLWLNPQCRLSRASIVAALHQLNPRVTSVELDSIQVPTNAVVGHTLGHKTLTIRLDQESSGFRRFLAFLLAVYQTPSKQTLIFEEPENGIFPGALAVLAEEFRATPEAGRGQVILTTHNPVFLNYFEPHQIRVAELDDNLETQIGPLAADQQESIREKLMDAGELFTTDRPRREVVAQ